ncbi:MAG: rhamnulose-1-phosphate aldolase [Bacteroidales bacterium]|nr:rhamnulose-1-phosphate aldolase [Bacteroidales bacterium]
MNKPLAQEIAKMAEVAGFLWQKGWAERNGGNIVINITDYVDDKLRRQPPMTDNPEYVVDGRTVKGFPIGKRLPHLKGCYFLCKGTNRRMRDLADNPMHNASIISILDDCEHYAIVANNFVMPTSELPSHLCVHNYLIANGSPYKASLHTHPVELVAMTHNRALLQKDAMTKILWSMIPETRAFCPKGLGIVSYMLPSSLELAEATIRTIDQGYDVVIWEKHGVFAVDTDIMTAFDQVDVLNKAAQIYQSARSMGFEPEGMNKEQMHELAVAFALPEKE